MGNLKWIMIVLFFSFPVVAQEARKAVPCDALSNQAIISEYFKAFSKGAYGGSKSLQCINKVDYPILRVNPEDLRYAESEGETLPLSDQSREELAESRIFWADEVSYAQVGPVQPQYEEGVITHIRVHYRIQAKGLRNPAQELKGFFSFKKYLGDTSNRFGCVDIWEVPTVLAIKKSCK